MQATKTHALLRALGSALLILGASAPATAADRPNVLFIPIDDLVPTLGCYGDPVALTPRIDTLAARGMTFLNHHCQWSVCGPSRAAMTTSLMPEETKVMGFKPIRAVLPDVITMPQHFRNNGYETACTGKFHDPRTVGVITDPDGQTSGGSATDDVLSWSIPYVRASSGFSPSGHPAVDDSDLPDSDYADHKILTEGLALIDTLASGNKPFFLGVGFKKPHLPFVAPQKYWNLYDREAMPLASFTDLPVKVSTNNRDCLTNNGEILGYEPYSATGLPDAAQQKELIQGYYACASFVDSLVGQLLDKLAATDDPVQEGKKMSETTIVVIWGDHGFHLGDHGKWAKHTAMERSTSCPLIIYDPRSSHSTAQTTSPVNTMDIYPTLCELAALPIPEQPLSDTQLTGRPLKGRSLVPILQDPGNSVHAGAISQFSKSGGYGYAYRTERFRYIEWVNGSNKVVARDLYDYKNDPLETKNLIDDPEFAAIAYQLSRSMRAETSTQGSTRLQNSPPISTGSDAILPGLEIAPGAANDFKLKWPGSGGVTYDILSNPDLTPGDWADFLSNVAGSQASFPISHPRNFFQVGFGDNTPPVFLADPLVKPTAEAGQPYSASLVDDALDPDPGDALTFAGVSGPSWLSVAGNGSLSGTPAPGDLGAGYFTVEVTDSLGATSQALLQITVEEIPTEPEILADWQLDDPAGTNLTGLQNFGSLASSFDRDAVNEIAADGMNHMMIGDDPGTNQVTTGITADRTSTALLVGGEKSKGVFEIEYHVGDWQLTTASGLGIEFDLSDADGTLLKTIFNSTNGAADTRIRLVDAGSGGTAGQVGGFGTTGSEGLTIRTTVDLDNGQWWSDYKLDSAGSFSSTISVQSLSADFSGITGIRLAAEGSTAWGSGDFISIGYIKLTELP